MKRKLFSAIVILSVLLGPVTGISPASWARAAGPICYVDDSASGVNNNGTTWTDAYKDLQSALGDAGCTVIQVAAGTYRPDDGSMKTATFQLRSGVTIQGGYPDGGGDTPDPTVHVTTLSGNGFNYHVVTGDGADNTALLDGFTIQGGSADDVFPNDRGAGVYIDGGSPRLHNLVINGNSSYHQGGGMYLTNSNAALNHVIFDGNATIFHADGGGLCKEGAGNLTLTAVTFLNNGSYTGGGAAIGGDATLNDVTFQNNTAGAQGAGLLIMNGSPALNNVSFTGNVVGPGSAGGNGGGMYIRNGSPSLMGVTFSNNLAYEFSGGIGGAGGGLYVMSASPMLDGVVFQNNAAQGGGGGLYIGNGNTVLNNVTFTDNQAGPGSRGGSGGGMYSGINASTSMTEVTFTTNKASSAGNLGGDGGGLYLSGPSANLTRVTFNKNSAVANAGIGGNGGGLYLSGIDASLTDVSITNNIADATIGGGGGMYISSANPTLKNVTVSGNSAYDGGGIYSTGDPRLETVSLLSNTAGGDGGGLWMSGNITMLNSRIDSNTASEGGGLALPIAATTGEFINVSITNNSVNLTSDTGGGVYTYSSAPHFTNLLLAGNSAWRGAGMANYAYSYPVIVNATIYGNQSADGGSAFSTYNSGPDLTDSIVWGNPDTNLGPDFISIGIFDFPVVNYSILEDAGCPGTGCTNLLHSDPQFIDPANSDYRIPPLSPAVDAGDTSAVPLDQFDLDGDGNLSEKIPHEMRGEPRIVLGRVDLGAYEAQVWNANWTEALTLPLEIVQPDVTSASINRYVDLPGQSRWFKFTVQPGSQVIVTLTGLPANYDLALYKDIAETYSELTSSQDLTQLSAEFAPDTFSPDTFSPDTFSPDTFSPDTYSPDTFSPDTFSPDTFSPDTFSPDTYSPDTFSPDTFSPDTFSPDTFSPDTFSPDTYSPDTFSPDTFSPDTFSPDTFSSAQTRSLIAVSAHEGAQGEGIIVNTWTKSGDFYVRVRGRNGAFDANAPFHLQVMQLSGACGQVSPVLPPSGISPNANNHHTLIVANLAKTDGTTAEINSLRTKLNTLAGRTAGKVVDLSNDPRVNAAYVQAQNHPACVYAMNLQAQAIKDVVDRYRALNPLEYIVLVGNDQAIPFFRYTDAALLASEIEYSPPVRDNTTSQASLKMGYVLTQDPYGATREVSYKAGTLPVPDLAVGRLVETAADINHMLDVYLNTPNGVVVPTNALVTGYDFLEDAANAVRDELRASLGQAAVDTLIMSRDLSPQDPAAWTADNLRASLFGRSHGIVFLAGHFSAVSALAADYKTRLTTAELAAATTDFTNSLVYSAGCHSGYNIVNADDVLNVTEEPDWAQAFARKGATFIGGTGYQYGDTDFIEYSERLYLELTRQLRYSSGPVAVGKALTQAKLAYLAETPVMRGIHEKSLLEATLFGLPMLQFNLPGRIPAPVDASVVTSLTTFEGDPGLTLGLKYSDLDVNLLNPDLTSQLIERTVTLDQTTGSGGMTTVNAVYLEGPDGVAVNPAEPVLPLDLLNVTAPQDGFVMRGTGWRGGAYTDLPGLTPLTGAATDDLRAPHSAFFSDVFYPIRPWNINYFNALSGSGGPTRLALMPAQYRSAAPGSLTGVLRRFDSMNFHLYYSDNISTYTSSDPTWTNTPALSAPPDISHITSSMNSDGSVSFEVTVTGDPAAGIQEAWIVYTYENGGTNGAWQPLDLDQDLTDTRLWKGTLPLNGASVADLRFYVQAVNGVGLVTMMTNQGAGYRAGVDPGAPPQGQLPVTLTLTSPPGSGPYGGQQSFTATATQNGTPLAGIPVTFDLGGQGRLAVTGSDGRATANFFLLANPGEYALTAAFDGNEAYAPAKVSAPFTVLQANSQISITPVYQQVFYSHTPQYTVTLTSSGLPLAGKNIALTLDAANGARLSTSVVVTDYAGQFRWQAPVLPVGAYMLTAWFGLKVSADLDLSTPYYTGSSATASLSVKPFSFSGFFSPVDNPPVYNKAKAGSAIPVKFRLGGNFGLNIFASGYPLVKSVSCSAKAAIGPVEQVTATANNLNYDPLTGQYNYVWKTDKKWAGSCRLLVLKFIDGTEKTALFQFTK